MGLFEPIWKTRLFHTDKEKKAVEYVRRLTSPEKLLEISLSAPSLDVRKAAVEGLGEEKLLLEAALAEIASRAVSRKARECAVREIGDLPLLSDFFKTPDAAVRLVKYFKEECIKPRPDDSVQPIWSKASGNLVNRILTGEDGFGRYSSSVTTVIYKGKRY